MVLWKMTFVGGKSFVGFRIVGVRGQGVLFKKKTRSQLRAHGVAQYMYRASRPTSKLAARKALWKTRLGKAH